MIPLLVITVAALIVATVYASHHSLPTRQTPRERLIRLNPMLFASDICWPEPRPIATLTERIRERLITFAISAALAASVRADRSGELYVPVWYDR